MFCKKCGKEHLEEAKFCPNCGASLTGDSIQQKKEMDVNLSSQSVQPAKDENQAQLEEKSAEGGKKDVKAANKRKSKKKYLVVSLILFLIFAGVYLMLRPDNKKEEKPFVFEKGDEISVVNQDNSRLVKNQTQKYSFETPSEWFVEETIAPIPGVAVWDESRKCKIHMGFIEDNSQSIDEIVKFSIEYSGATTVAVKDFVLIDRHKGKRLLHRYGNDPIVRYISAYVDVAGKMFSLSSGGERCDSAEDYFSSVVPTIKFK